MSALSDEAVQRILDDVRKKLKARAVRSGVSLELAEGGYRQGDDWLEVVVRPMESGVRAYDYVEELVAVEDELRREGVEKVVLVPALTE